MKALAVVCWVLAWCFLGLIPAALFAAKDGKVRTAWTELATGALGSAVLAFAGAVLW